MTDAQFSAFLFHLMRQINLEISQIELQMMEAGLDMEARRHWLLGLYGLSDVLREQAATAGRASQKSS